MKILCLADLHMDSDYMFLHIKKILTRINENFDVVFIAGDIFESNYMTTVNPYEKISLMFPDKPVVCVLGNHEFWRKTPKQVVDFYTDLYEPDKHNVRYLDVVDFYDINNFRVVGNFLGYDGSINPENNKFPDQFHKWKDGLIHNWRGYKWKSYCKQCQKIIVDNMSTTLENVLLTHTTPHKRLNLHDDSNFNVYSGISGFLEQHSFRLAICGHTHLRSVGLVINGCDCVNVGSDYCYFNYEIVDV